MHSMIRVLLVGVLLFLTGSTSASFFETLSVQDTIGSHFGAPSVDAAYDFVVVGGGTAGLTIAHRLSEGGRYSVAIVEAGSFYEMTNSNFSQVPALTGNFVGSNPRLKNPLVDWVQWTQPVEGLGQRKILYTSGKALGGSSARNYMLYMRSTVGAYHQWAKQVGDLTYEYSSFERYFKKTIKFSPPNNAARSHNSTPKYDEQSIASAMQEGPLSVTYPNFATSFASWVIKALKEFGLQETRGFAGGNILGYSYALFAMDQLSQTRQSSETSFLREAFRSNSQLLMYQMTLAKRIIFDSSKVAKAVLVESGGIAYQLNATREVVVSCGTFRSPQLLMVSGVGPRASLQEHGIPLVVDRPGVGRNMMDHVIFGTARAVNLITHSALAVPQYTAEQLELYKNNRTGAYSSTGGELIAFEKLSTALRSTISEDTRKSLDDNPSDWPDIELLYSDAYAGDNSDLTSELPPDPSLMYGTSEAALASPFSRGNISISSNSTNDNPVLNANFLQDKRDREVAIAAFKRARQVWQTAAMKQVTIGGEAYPGANYSSDQQILEAIKTSALPVYHASSTCAMGRRGDSMAVVDSEARVIGVHNLRVVDASAFPFLPPGHPQGTVYALAEKIADNILGKT